MSRGFIFIHGLPGAGKTSLCRRLGEIRRDMYYADTRSSAAWGSEHMWKICADLYAEGGKDKWLVTEGMAAQRAARDRFVSKTIAYLGDKAGVMFNSAHIVHLVDPGSDVLSQRRNRTIAQYEELREGVQTGSQFYDYSIFACRPDEDVNAVASRFSQLVDEWKVQASADDQCD